MFCFHKYKEPVNRYQTCEKCGKIRNVECNHIWEEIDLIYINPIRDYNGNIYLWGSRKVRQKCKLCGHQRYLLL